MSVARFFALGMVLGVVGCGADGAEEAPIPRLTVSRTTTFGDLEGDGALSQVWGVAASPDGRVFLSEPQFARVVWFAPDGTFGGVVGSRGQGPGEFTVPGAIGWRGDSLAVTDFQRGISLFSPDGAFGDLISFNINDGSSPFGVRPLLALADGSVGAMAPPANNQVTEGAVAREVWLRTTRDGVILDTLVATALEGRLFSVSHQGRERSGNHPVAWAPLLAVPPTATSFVVVDRPPAQTPERASYQVIRVGLTGDTVARVTLAYDPVPLAGGQVDSIAGAMAGRWAAGMETKPAALAADIVDQIEWPAYQPPVTTVLAGADGSVWLRREMIGASAARWDILDASLTPVGWVELPVELDVKVVGMDRVYGVELDELDVPKVVRVDVGGGG